MDRITYRFHRSVYRPLCGVQFSSVVSMILYKEVVCLILFVHLAKSTYLAIDGQGCTPWGFPCNNSLTTCCSEGSWPGGRRNCYGSPPNLFCYCTIPGYQCQSDRQCCSNKCAKGKCDVGWKNDICDPKSKLPQCGEGLSCTPFAIEVGHVYEMFGECLVKSADCERYGMLCFRNTQCCPVGSWKGEICQPASKNVVDDSLSFCHCRVDSCLQDGDCCSGKCAQNTCVPGKLGDLCDMENSINACNTGLKCIAPISDVNIQRFLDTHEHTKYGRCYHDGDCLEFGAECTTDLHTCCPYGYWPGGPICKPSRNPHLSGRLFCLCSLFNCKDDTECCSGSCVNGMCQNSTEPGSVCSKDPNSCRKLKCRLTLKEGKFNEAVRLHWLSEYGICPLNPNADDDGCVSEGQDCITESKCCSLGGISALSCLRKGRPEIITGEFDGTCLCLGYSSTPPAMCGNDGHCCSGNCVVAGGTCLPSAKGKICPLDDPSSTCMPGLECTPDSSLDSNRYGYCTLDSKSVPIGHHCNLDYRCAAVGSFPGWYGKCFIEEGDNRYDQGCGCYVENGPYDVPDGKFMCSDRPAGGQSIEKKLIDICHYGKSDLDHDHDNCYWTDPKTSCQLVPSSEDGPVPYHICWPSPPYEAIGEGFIDYSQLNKDSD